MQTNTARRHLTDPPSALEWTRTTPEISSLPDWRRAAETRLREILLLPQGWDSYRAKPIRKDTIDFAWSVLENIIMEWSKAPLPSIVPTPGGGVQLEWHEKDIDLELHIAEPYDCDLFFEDHRDGQSIEVHITKDFEQFTRPIWLLAARA